MLIVNERFVRFMIMKLKYMLTTLLVEPSFTFQLLVYFFIFYYVVL